jgi:hypothetical protein
MNRHDRRRGRSTTPRPSIDPDARDSISEAFQHILRHCAGAGHLAREQLNGALRIGGGAPGGVRLWVDDTIVDPNWYAGHMRVAAKVAPDGQWSAWLEPQGGRPVERGPHAWSVSARDVAALVKSTADHKHVEWLLTEAAAYVVANGLPESKAGQQTAEALYLGLANILGKDKRFPGRTVGIDILAPLVRRIKEALKR